MAVIPPEVFVPVGEGVGLSVRRGVTVGAAAVGESTGIGVGAGVGLEEGEASGIGDIGRNGCGEAEGRTNAVGVQARATVSH